MSEPVVALDIGRTTPASGLVTADGTVLRSVAHPALQGDGGRDPGLAGTLAAARDMTGAAAALGAPVVGIGAGFPEHGTGADRLTSREVLDWTVQPTRLLAPLAPGRPVAVESDVRCGALAEARLGSGARLAPVHLPGHRAVRRARAGRPGVGGAGAERPWRWAPGRCPPPSTRTSPPPRPSGVRLLRGGTSRARASPTPCTGGVRRHLRSTPRARVSPPGTRPPPVPT